MRISLYIPLNFAEGNGRWHKAATKHYENLSEIAKILSGLIRSVDLLKDKPAS